VSSSQAIFRVELGKDWGGPRDLSRLDVSEYEMLASFSSTGKNAEDTPVTLRVVTLPTGVEHYLIPQRPVLLVNPTVTSLVSYEEGLPEAVQNRAYSHQAQVESLDRRVTLFLSPEAHTFRPSSDTRIREDSSLDGLQAVVVDEAGIAWGPFPLDPHTEPVKWPYPGVITSHNVKGGVWTKLRHPITLTPDGDGWVISDGILSARFDVSDGLRFASTLAVTEGDWRKALHMAFPGFTARIGYIAQPPAGSNAG
jgi:hypothetical protein